MTRSAPKRSAIPPASTLARQRRRASEAQSAQLKARNNGGLCVLGRLMWGLLFHRDQGLVPPSVPRPKSRGANLDS